MWCRIVSRGSWTLPAATWRSLSSSALPKHKVTPFNRFILKLTRTVDPVPTEVSFEVMDKANSRFRIGLTSFMMLFCLVGSWIAIQQGRHLAEEGQSTVYHKNRERYSDSANRAKK